MISRFAVFTSYQVNVAAGGFNIVGDAFAEFERAVFAPDFTRFAREAAIVLEFLLRDRHDKSVDIGHGNLRKLRTILQLALCLKHLSRS
jgi:hypothetical protein